MSGIGDSTEALLAELRSTRRRNLPFMALGVVAALVALAGMAWLVAENRRQAAEIERQATRSQLQAIELQREAALAQQRLAQLDRILLQIEQKGGGASQLASKAITQATAANAALDRGQSPNLDPADLDSISTPPITVTPGLQTVATGAQNGWDIDLFWCAGPGEAGNYAGARLASIVLAIEAARQRAIAPGVRLGRVRLRPVREQDRAAWPAGFYAVSDAGTGEDEAAEAVAAFLTRSQPLPATRRRSTGKATPYYLSVFACN